MISNHMSRIGGTMDGGMSGITCGMEGARGRRR